MLIDHWPLLGLRLDTERLELRLPDEAELAELAETASRGVHDPEHSPFLTPWTEGPPAEVARTVIQYHWLRRGTWSPEDWMLSLAVFRDGRPIGQQSLRAREFAALREVQTGSWLGRDHQGRGLGTEMRAAVLHLAFAGLGATDAVSTAFTDNPSSLAVSRHLGYRPDGIQRDLLRGRPVVSQRLRLTREQWELTNRPTVRITGLHPCLPDFGLDPASDPDPEPDPASDPDPEPEPEPDPEPPADRPRS